MKKDIINANNKIVGYIDISESKIIICSNSKPPVIIDDKKSIKKIADKDEGFIVSLYDDYTLTIAEISALYDMRYFRMANLIKTLPVKTHKKSGRRNSSFALKFSEERLRNMSKAQLGHPSKSTYIRTPEIKEKISKTLKEGYASGRIKQDAELKSKAWADGKYANAKMGRGIQGYFHSFKMDKDMYFRSLLELKFLLIVENDERVLTYRMEPFQIRLPHNMHYTPDMIINEKVVVELKPKDLYKYQDTKRFHIEIACLNDYCKKNGLGFILVYDTDVRFESRQFRRYIKNNPEIIKQYDIRFKKEL